jgi:signal transduction histidine kinase
VDSLTGRLALVVFLAATIPLLFAVLPGLTPSGGPASMSVGVMVFGWVLVIVGVTGAASWAVARALLRPVVRLAAQMGPTAVGGRGAQHAVPERDPAEIRLVRAAVLGREEVRRRESSERSVYVSTLIHDMKTPLLAVAQSLALAEAEPEFAKRRAWQKAAAEEVRRLLGMVEDVVDAERLATGALQVRFAAVDLNGVAERVAARLATLRGDVRVRVQRGSPYPHVGDAVLLERAIENIAENALRHARSSVVVEVMPGLVRVADDGPGLPSDFVGIGLMEAPRGSTASLDTSSRRSSGLGLFIAKRVAEAHGGRLVVESTGPSGTTLLLYVGTPQLARGSL